jgi:hypothetical protein
VAGVACDPIRRRRCANIAGLRYLLSDDAPFNPVLASLPPLIRVRGSQGPLARWVEASVQYALHASECRDPERDPLLKRLPELLLMECLCEHVRQQPDSNGWLAALADPIVGRALGCMHQQPDRPWTLHELAKRAAASRSTLDERFRAGGFAANPINRVVTMFDPTTAKM